MDLVLKPFDDSGVCCVFVLLQHRNHRLFDLEFSLQGKPQLSGFDVPNWRSIFLAVRVARKNYELGPNGCLSLTVGVPTHPFHLKFSPPPRAPESQKSVPSRTRVGSGAPPSGSPPFARSSVEWPPCHSRSRYGELLAHPRPPEHGPSSSAQRRCFVPFSCTCPLPSVPWPRLNGSSAGRARLLHPRIPTRHVDLAHLLTGRGSTLREVQTSRTRRIVELLDRFPGLSLGPQRGMSSTL